MNKKAIPHLCALRVETADGVQCNVNIRNTIESVYFDKETGYVFNEHGEKIGSGVYRNGLLEVRINTE